MDTEDKPRGVPELVSFLVGSVNELRAGFEYGKTDILGEVYV